MEKRREKMRVLIGRDFNAKTGREGESAEEEEVLRIQRIYK